MSRLDLYYALIRVLKVVVTIAYVVVTTIAMIFWFILKGLFHNKGRC